MHLIHTGICSFPNSENGLAAYRYRVLRRWQGRRIGFLSSCREAAPDVILRLSKSCTETTLLRTFDLNASLSFAFICCTTGHKLGIMGIKTVFSAANTCWMDVFSLNLSNSYNSLVVSIIAFSGTFYFWQRFIGQFWLPLLRYDSCPVVFSGQRCRTAVTKADLWDLTWR